MLKRLLSLFLGFIAAMAVVLLTQYYTRGMHPPPDDLIFNDMEARESYLLGLPMKVRYYFFASHLVGAFLGSYIAARLADKHKYYMGLIVGLIFLISTISHNFGMMSPGWLIVIDFVACVFMILLASRVSSRI